MDRGSAPLVLDIHDYIAADNPDAAQKVVADIFEKAQLLRSFPEIGHKYRVEAEGEMRVLLYGHYRIAYLLRSSPGSIDILGVFQARSILIDIFSPRKAQ